MEQSFKFKEKQPATKKIKSEPSEQKKGEDELTKFLKSKTVDELRKITPKTLTAEQKRLFSTEYIEKMKDDNDKKTYEFVIERRIKAIVDAEIQERKKQGKILSFKDIEGAKKKIIAENTDADFVKQIKEHDKDEDDKHADEESSSEEEDNIAVPESEEGAGEEEEEEEEEQEDQDVMDIFSTINNFSTEKTKVAREEAILSDDEDAAAEPQDEEDYEDDAEELDDSTLTTYAEIINKYDEKIDKVIQEKEAQLAPLEAILVAFTKKARDAAESQRKRRNRRSKNPEPEPDYIKRLEQFKGLNIEHLQKMRTEGGESKIFEMYEQLRGKIVEKANKKLMALAEKKEAELEPLFAKYESTIGKYAPVDEDETIEQAEERLLAERAKKVVQKKVQEETRKERLKLMKKELNAMKVSRLTALEQDTKEELNALEEEISKMAEGPEKEAKKEEMEDQLLLHMNIIYKLMLLESPESDNLDVDSYLVRDKFKSDVFYIAISVNPADANSEKVLKRVDIHNLELPVRPKGNELIVPPGIQNLKNDPDGYQTICDVCGHQNKRGDPKKRRFRYWYSDEGKIEKVACNACWNAMDVRSGRKKLRQIDLDLNTFKLMEDKQKEENVEMKLKAKIEKYKIKLEKEQIKLEKKRAKRLKAIEKASKPAKPPKKKLTELEKKQKEIEKAQKALEKEKKKAEKEARKAEKEAKKAEKEAKRLAKEAKKVGKQIDLQGQLVEDVQRSADMEALRDKKVSKKKPIDTQQPVVTSPYFSQPPTVTSPYFHSSPAERKKVKAPRRTPEEIQEQKNLLEMVGTMMEIEKQQEEPAEQQTTSQCHKGRPLIDLYGRDSDDEYEEEQDPYDDDY